MKDVSCNTDSDSAEEAYAAGIEEGENRVVAETDLLRTAIDHSRRQRQRKTRTNTQRAAFERLADEQMRAAEENAKQQRKRQRSDCASRQALTGSGIDLVVARAETTEIAPSGAAAIAEVMRRAAEPCTSGTIPDAVTGLRADDDVQRECHAAPPKRDVPVTRQDAVSDEQARDGGESVAGRRRNEIAARLSDVVPEGIAREATPPPTLATPSPLPELMPLPSVAEWVEENDEHMTSRQDFVVRLTGGDDSIPPPGEYRDIMEPDGEHGDSVVTPEVWWSVTAARVNRVGKNGERYAYGARSRCSLCVHATSRCPTVAAFAVSHVDLETLGPRDLSAFRPYEGLAPDAAAAPNLFAQTRVNGEPIAAIMDSGAGTTLMNGAIFDSIPGTASLPLLPSLLDFQSALAGQANFDVRGVVALTVEIAGISAMARVTVVDNLGAQCLLGADFMLRNRIRLDYDAILVTSPRGTTPFIAATRRSGHMYAVLTQHRVNVTRALKPQTKTNMLLSVPEDVREGTAFLVEPSPSATRLGLLASRSVSIVRQGLIAVQVLNVTNRVVRITDHDEVATLTSDFELIPHDEDSTAAVFAAFTGAVQTAPPHTCSPQGDCPPQGEGPWPLDSDYVLQNVYAYARQYRRATVPPREGERTQQIVKAINAIKETSAPTLDTSTELPGQEPADARLSTSEVTETAMPPPHTEIANASLQPVYLRTAKANREDSDATSRRDRNEAEPRSRPSPPTNIRILMTANPGNGEHKRYACDCHACIVAATDRSVTATTESRIDNETHIGSGTAIGSGRVPIHAPVELAPELLPRLEALRSILDRLDLTRSEFAPGEPYFLPFVRFVWLHLDRFAAHADDYGHATMTKCHIKTEPGVAPICQRARPVPIHVQEKVRKELQGMLDANIIRPSTSEWSSPIVIVKKKDGGIRLCVDFRAVNDVTWKDSFPLPRIDDLLERLHGAHLFSAMDLQKGFHQIELDEESREKTAFAVPWGLFEYTVMPFGICNGPSVFQRMITLALGDRLGIDCLGYIDDLLAFSQDEMEMLAKLDGIFTRLRIAGLKVKPEKCFFGVKRVEFLGHEVSAAGIAPMDAKLDKIAAAPRPHDRRALRAFLGYINYYRDYIREFALLASPLYELLRKDISWCWADAHDVAFVAVKTAFRSAPILAHPSSAEHDVFVLDTDASHDGMGGVLSQIQNGRERPICFASRIFSKAERNYDVTRRELLAVVVFTNRFRHFLYGRAFILRTDHSALRWLFNTLELTAQSTRWILRLADFDMVIKHRPGELHANADGLSRAPLLLSAGVLEELPADHPLRPLIPPSEFEQTVAVNYANAMLRIHNPPSTFVDSVLTKYKDPPPGETLQFLLQQRRDTLLTRVREHIRHDSWPSAKDVTMTGDEFRTYHALRRHLTVLGADDDGILLYQNLSRDWTATALPGAYVVPRDARCSVIAEAHNAVTGSHFGNHKTLETLRQRFCWPNMEFDVTLYCRLCETCQLTANRGRHKEPMQHLDAGAPWEVLGIDYVGPLPRTRHGNTAILTMVDHFYRLVVLAPVKHMTAKLTVQAILENWVAYYGVPRCIHSDQGRHFENDLMQLVLARLTVRKTRTTAYRPQADGRVERANRTIKQCITRLMLDTGKVWDDLLPFVQMAMNATVHDTTGYTPFLLAHGTEMQLPLDLAYGPPPAPYSSHDDYVNALCARMQKAFS